MREKVERGWGGGTGGVETGAGIKRAGGGAARVEWCERGDWSVVRPAALVGRSQSCAT